MVRKFEMLRTFTFHTIEYYTIHGADEIDTVSINQTWQWEIHYLQVIFPIETPISSGFPIATFDSRRVPGGAPQFQIGL